MKFEAHRLLENDDQVDVYFHFLNEANRVATMQNKNNQAFFMPDVIKAMVASAAVAAYTCTDQSRLREENRDNVEEWKKIFCDTLDALKSDTNIKQFVSN